MAPSHVERTAPLKTFRLKDPASALTHLLGVVLSVAALVLLIQRSLESGLTWQKVSFPIFGTSLLLLYTASTLYHALPGSPERTRALRKFDHAMIFMLIAGSYTPFCAGPLWGPWGWSLLVAVWTLAVGGCVLKVLWLEAPEWLSLSLYLGMGWLVVLAAQPLYQNLPTPSLAWIVTGGLAYTLGAVFYGARWPDPWPGVFGHHEIWHVCVLGGSFSHFLAVMALA